MSAAAPARFTFDLDLGKREERNRLLSEAALAAVRHEARMDGFASGYAEGQSGVEAQAAQVLAAAADNLADRAATFAELLDDAKATIRTQAAELAREMAFKLAGQLVTRQPEAELMALLDDCLASLDNVPHLVIRCHPTLAERIREGAETRIASAGFKGRLVVIADPELALSDGRIEWADGGLRRDVATTSAAIDAAIATYLETHGTRS